VGHDGLMFNYVIVRHWNDVSFVSVIIICLVSIGVAGFSVSALSLGGNNTQEFGKVMASWKYLRTGSKKETTFMKKFRNSFRPIVIGLEGYIKLTIRRISACKHLYMDILEVHLGYFLLYDELIAANKLTLILLFELS